LSKPAPSARSSTPSAGARRPPEKGIANDVRGRRRRRGRRWKRTEREHAKKAADIQAEEKRSRAEDDRWKMEKEQLQAALRRARD